MGSLDRDIPTFPATRPFRCATIGPASPPPLQELINITDIFSRIFFHVFTLTLFVLRPMCAFRFLPLRIQHLGLSVPLFVSIGYFFCVFP